MNSYPHPRRGSSPPPADPMDYVARRLSPLLAVAGGVLGIAVMSLLEGAGLPTPASVAVGLVLFLAAAILASNLSARDTRVASAPARDDSDVDVSYAAGHSRGEWGQASQLGPDPEQVIGRQTGARI